MNTDHWTRPHLRRNCTAQSYLFLEVPDPPASTTPSTGSFGFKQHLCIGFCSQRALWEQKQALHLKITHFHKVSLFIKFTKPEVTPVTVKVTAVTLYGNKIKSWGASKHQWIVLTTETKENTTISMDMSPWGCLYHQSRTFPPAATPGSLCNPHGSQSHSSSLILQIHLKKIHFHRF